MPESAKDRPSRCYEHIFLLTKSGKYFYDNLAVAEPIALSTAIRYRYGRKENTKYADGIPGQMSRQQINNPCRDGISGMCGISIPFHIKGHILQHFRHVWRKPVSLRDAQNRGLSLIRLWEAGQPGLWQKG